MMSLTEIAAVGLFAIKVLESNLAAQASVYVIVSKHQNLRLEKHLVPGTLPQLLTANYVSPLLVTRTTPTCFSYMR